MDCRSRARPRGASVLQMRNELCRERRERRETATEAGHHEQSPLWRNRGGRSEKCDRQPNDLAADQIRGERAGRNEREEGVELRSEPPAQ
jgi:hypothetical protein